MTQQNLPPSTQIYVSQPSQPSNGLGITGFILSLVGLLTCGILSPIALILSLIGLRKQPKGLAIAGTVISLVSLIPLVIFGASLFTMVLGFLGLASAASKQLAVQAANQTAAHDAAVIIEDHRAPDGSLPSDDVGTQLIAGKFDYWKTPLHYRRSDDTFAIISAGSDTHFGNADDISFSEATLIAPKPTTGTTRPDATDNATTPKDGDSK